jgi:hypothetical protein
MFRETKNQADVGTVPLQTAVLCLDCETVAESRSDGCPVCGGRSIFNIARLLGSTLPAEKASSFPKAEDVLLFDLEITINLRRIEAKGLNVAVETITGLIGPGLGGGRASCHINVEPVVNSGAACEAEAA